MSRWLPRPSQPRMSLVLGLGLGLALGVGLGLGLDRFGATVRIVPSARAAAPEEISRRDYGIAGFKTPPRWELRPRDRANYPQLLAWAERVQGGDRAVMTLVGKRLPDGTTLAQFAEQSAALRDHGRIQGLRSQTQRASLWPGGQRVQLDAQLAGKDGQRAQIMRQYLYWNPPFGYVLTLVAPPEQAAARLRDLDDTAQNLTPLPPEAPPPPPLPSPRDEPPK